MKVLRVASLDFRGNAWLLGLALLLGLLAWVLPWFIPHPGGNPSAARAAFAGVLALGTVIAASLLLGASLWATDLQEGRMSFFLARPLRSQDLFLGRLVSAFGLVFLCGLLTFMPALSSLKAVREALGSLGFLAGLSVWILLMAHLASISLRARTSWILLDLASLGVLGAILLECMNMVVSLLWTANESLSFSLGSFLGGLLVLGAGAFAALAHGRVLLPRAHRAMSITVCAGMLLVGGAGAVVRRVMLRVRPADFPSVAWASGGMEGPWLAVRSSGLPGQGRVRTALFNTATRRGFRLPVSELRFSRDGRVAVWWEFRLSPFGGGVTLRRAKLGPESATVEDTGIHPYLVPGEWNGSNQDLVVSEDGHRVAWIAGGRLTVHDLRTGARLFHQALEGVGPAPLSDRGGLLFLDGERLRIYVPGEDLRAPLGIYEVNLAKGQMVRTGSLEEPSFRPIQTMDAGASRLVLDRSQGAERMLELRDARTGALIAGLMRGSREPRVQVSFLADGTLILLAVDSRKASLNRFDPEGRPQWEVSLPVQGSDGTVLPALDASAGPDAAKVTLYARNASGEKVVSTYRVDLRQGRCVPDANAVPLRAVRGPETLRRPDPSAVFYRRFAITDSGSLVTTSLGGTSEWVLGPR